MLAEFLDYAIIKIQLDELKNTQNIIQYIDNISKGKHIMNFISNESKKNPIILIDKLENIFSKNEKKTIKKIIKKNFINNIEKINSIFIALINQQPESMMWF